MVSQSDSLFWPAGFQHRNQAFGDMVLYISDRVPQVFLQADIGCFLELTHAS